MKKVFSLLISNFILAIVFANKVLAQDVFGINELSEGGIALGTRSIQDTIAGIINIFLGFLGTLATILLLYAGYLWMTSGGNAQKVAKAKLMISSALIGLVIILSAYAISRFILQELYDVTEPAGPTTCTVPENCSSLCCVAGFCESSSVCAAPSLTCSEPGVGLEEEPRICSLNRISGPVGTGITIRGWNFDTDGDGLPGVGRVEIDGVPAEVVECAGTPIWEDRKVKIKVPDSLTAGISYPLVLYNDAGNNNETFFESFDFFVEAGVSEINIDCLVPNPVDVVDLPMISPDVLSVLGDGFGTTEEIVNIYSGVDGDILLDLHVLSWSDIQIDVEIPDTVISSNLSVVIGMAPEDRAYEFLDISCEDASAGSCVSGCCDNNSCLPADVCAGSIVVPIEDIPVIEGLSPEDGEGQTLVTISGYNFGDDADLGNANVDERGSVVFIGGAGDIIGELPDSINASCENYWTDNYIIMAVPMGADDELLGVEVTQALTYGGETSQLFLGFEKNTVSRPGICYLSPDEGVFGEYIDIEGVNFTATDTAYFDAMYTYDTGFIDDTSVRSQIPNIYGNLGVTMRTNDATPILSNAFPFEALSVSGGDPIITELSPNNGPVDSYVTIMGSGFGDETGVVYFDLDNNPTNLNEEIGGIDFPVQCGDYWFDDHIIIKVPSGAWTIDDDYPIRVERFSDGVMSNDFDFTITDVAPGPQICAIVPDNGPINFDEVEIFGENLGSDDLANLVTFHESVNTTFGIWNASQVLGIEVPLNASAGPVTVTDSDGNESNALPFDVGTCTANSQCDGDICCDDGYCAVSCEAELNSCSYSWIVETDNEPFGLHYNYECESDLQSPSPWPDLHTYEIDEVEYVGHSLDAFVDTNISALFTRDVEDEDFNLDINSDNVRVWQCNTGGASLNIAACTIEIFDANLDGDEILTILNSNTAREGFVFDPAADLVPDTWYNVVLGTFHAEVGSDTWTNPDDWHFKTRADDLLCVVDNVVVTPQYPQSNMYPGQEKNFSASPTAANCNICGGAYEWDWEVTHNPGPVGDYVVIPAGAEHNNNVNIGYSRLEGGPGATQFIVDNFVTLTAENIDYSVSNYSESMILAPVLRVVDRVTTCNDSCPDAELWVDFNTTLQGPLDVDDFAIYRCDDSTCDTLDTFNYVTGIDHYAIPNAYRVEIDHDPLVLDTYFKIFVYGPSGSIENTHGYALESDETWTFATGDHDCVLSAVDIIPSNYTTYNTNDINYVALPQADTSCGLQVIDCDTCTYDWDSSNDLTVASIDTGAKIVAATPVETIGDTVISVDVNDLVTGGSGVNSTDLHVDVSGIVTPATDLTLLSFEPNCGSDHTCANAQILGRFNTPIVLASVSGEVRVWENISGDDVLIDFHLIDGDKTIVLETTPLELGIEYNVNFNAGIRNTYGDIYGANFNYGFTVGEEECRINTVDVLPDDIIVGANQDTTYSAQTLITTIPDCGAIPVYCDTCSYTWSDSDSLGTFNNTTFDDPIFTTNSSVITGQTTNIEVEVEDQGETFNDFGLLTIDVAPGDTVDLRSHEPIISPACNNIASYFIFDISAGLLDKASVRDNMKLYEACTTPGPWCLVDGNISFAEDIPDTEWAIFNQTNLLTNNTVHLLMLENSDLVVSRDGNPITISDSLVVNHPDFGPNDRGFTFITSDESCSIHSVEIDYNEGEELFTCIEDDCEGDWAGTAGNQHQYRSIVRDIRNTVLAASTITMTYDWESLNIDIFYPETATDYEIFATANNNGITNLNLEVFLVSEPDNIVSTNEPLEVNTCEVPWPSLSTYPWNDGEELNFSTYYCQNYDASSPATLPNISVPHTTASPDLNVIEEFITTINYGITDSGQQNPYLGSLAYNNEESKLEDSWADKLSSLFETEKAQGEAFGCTPRRPGNLNYIYDSLVGEVEITWRQVAAIPGFTDPEYFEIQRDLEGDESGYAYLTNYNPASPIVGNHSYIDDTIDANSVYNYRIIARNNDCSGWDPSMPTGWEPIEDNPVVIVNTYSSSESIVDIIGFRVMKNDEHLSVSEWYSKMFPTAEDSGALIEVDGYEALQVGSTVYVAASNAYDPGNTLYTNIYIIAHNIGANTETLNIYAQMLDNFKLNTNIPGDLNSVCSGQSDLSCSSDFDCPTWCQNGSGIDEASCDVGLWVSDSCDARLLKLRRDTKRLSDLVSIDNAILAYGQANKACETNSLISCEEDTDCPGGTCIPYYPPLNAGSYLDGLSNTSWPSWQGALSNTFNIPLPLDPINLFNGCGDTPEGHDVNTCWNEASLEFACSDNSLVYMYNINGIGQSYYLGAQFEYDSIISAPPTITFAGNLDHPVTMDLGQVNCSGGSVAAPGATLNPYCGNGIPGESYCSVRCVGCDTNTTLCNAGGGIIITEECDSEFWNFACSEHPSGGPIVGPGGSNGWWDEQTIGCHPPGAVDTDTNTLTECTWYIPDPEFTAAQCGGYCGDGTVQSYYESCDDNASVPSGYICVDGPASLCSSGCQVMCDDSAGEYPAALCGDGIWSEEIEDCDPSASPSGVANWDCTEGGNIGCSASCIRTCTIGDPYPGLCGDGNLDSLEECDYAGYEQPSPPESGPNPSPSYGCTELCEMNNEYCGDGTLQYEDGHEICDYDAFYSVPDPLASDEYRQYACRDDGTYTATNGSEHGACSATLGGYCGDGFIDIYGYCDIDCPACEGLSGLARHQACAAAGGSSYTYYADGSDPAEECDPGSPWDGIDPSPLPPSTVDSSSSNQYFCDIDCVGTTGGYCGDGIRQSVATNPIAYENCDGVDYPDRPLPAASDENNTYDCAINCIDTVSGADGGRYCGDGILHEEFHESCDWTSADYPWPRGSDLGNFSGVGNEYACYECVNQGGYCGDGDIDGECNVNCAGWNGSAWTSPHCDLDECLTAPGGTHFVEQYEDCDSGWNPNTLLDKEVDMVYVFDMSGSMADRASALCTATQGVVDQLVDDGVEHRITIFVLGDNDGTVSLTAGTSDDIVELSPWLTTWGWIDEAQTVFYNLYTDCGLLDDDYPETVRYLSFYENDGVTEPDYYNHITGGVSTEGDSALYGQTCNDTADGAGRVENWGYAMARIIEDYDWLPDFTRIIVPVSDEGAYCGSNTSTLLENENCTPPGYNGGIDVLFNSIVLANAADPVVHINPVLFNTFDPLAYVKGACLADGTGGYYSDSTDGWAAQTLDVINSTFCDGDENGFMDCTFVQ